jgi:hypothetical protein
MTLGRFLWEDFKTLLIAVVGVVVTVVALGAGDASGIVLGVVLAVGGAVKLRLDWPRAQRGDTRWLN